LRAVGRRTLPSAMPASPAASDGVAKATSRILSGGRRHRTQNGAGQNVPGPTADKMSALRDAGAPHLIRRIVSG
jgi:hypothetical protein